MVDIKNLESKRSHTKRPSTKGDLPPETTPDFNLSKPASGKKVPLQLNISPELRREFKGYANDHDTNASELFAAVWAHYKATHG